MQKKDILGYGWMRGRFLFESSMKKVHGLYEGYSAMQRFLPGSRGLYVFDSGEKQCLSGEGYKWLTFLPMDETWALLTFYTPQNELLRWYLDISRRNYIDENGMPCRDDLYLDLIVLRDGRTITKDADELQEALDSGDICIDDYAHAYAVRDRLLSGQWVDVDFLTAFCGELLAEYV